MSLRHTWLGLGIVCLLTAGVRADDNKEVLTILTNQTEFLRQEPILLTLRIEGESATSLPASLGGESPSQALRFEIEPPVKLRKEAKPLPLESQVASSKTRKYDLLEWFEFPASGSFTVRAVYENGGHRVNSAPFQLTLRNPKKGDADFDAVDRIHHVPWSNYETNAFCGDTFDVVKRWPDSKLARYCHYWNGRYSQHQKEYAKAIASYEELLAKYPKFALADDARQGIEECRKAAK